jgi:hypothetical protein
MMPPQLQPRKAACVSRLIGHDHARPDTHLAPQLDQSAVVKASQISYAGPTARGTSLTGPASENRLHKPTSSALSMRLPRTPQVVTISTVGSGRCSAPSDLLDRKGARQITEAAHEAASDSSIPVWRW